MKNMEKTDFSPPFSPLLLENPALPLKEAVSLTAEAAAASSFPLSRLTRGKMRILKQRTPPAPSGGPPPIRRWPPSPPKA